MKAFPELAQTQGYWLTKFQNDLYNCVEDYRDAKGWTRTQLADHLGYTKGYISQVLNGDFNHRISKLIELSLAVGVVPNIKFQPLEEYVEDYMSGYDFCINATNVITTITVNNRESFSIPRDRDQSTNKTFLVDSEVDITYYSIDADSNLELEYV